MPNILNAQDFPGEFDRALNAGDIDHLLALYEADATILTSDGQIASGLAAVRNELQSLILAKARIENRLRHTLRQGDIALIIVDWNLHLTTPDGCQIATEGTATNVLREDPSHGWRMLIGNPRGTAIRS